MYYTYPKKKHLKSEKKKEEEKIKNFDNDYLKI